MNPLKLSTLAVGLALIIQSCTGPTYVETTPPPPPPPPAYVQPTPPPPAQQPYYSDNQDAPAPVSYQSFYNELSPYGQWISTPDYGYVWVPAAGPDFQPYGSCGHWVLSDYGWTWVSDYSWGWAPFHYGTWDFDGTIGWYWIPGYQWSPAWVSWRSEPGYYGWAPLGPSYVSVGYANYYCPPERYVFVSANYMGDPNIVRYYAPRNQCIGYYNHSTVINNTYYDRGSNITYYAGPRREEVEGYTHTQIQPVSVVQSGSPERTGVSGNQIRMYRPAVQQQNGNNAVRPAPQTVYQRNNIAPLAQRPVLTKPNQPRVAPFTPENNQRPNNGEQNRQQQPAQQQQQYHAPAQQPQQQPAQQQQQQYHAPAQQPQQQPAQQQQQQYHAPAQQPQQQPAQQQQQQYHAPAQQSQQQPAQQQQQQYHAPAQQPQQQQSHAPVHQVPVKQTKRQIKQQQKQQSQQRQEPAKQ